VLILVCVNPRVSVILFGTVRRRLEEVWPLEGAYDDAYRGLTGARTRSNGEPVHMRMVFAAGFRRFVAV